VHWTSVDSVFSFYFALPCRLQFSASFSSNSLPSRWLLSYQPHS
jgi:hypothetical protein